MGWPQGCLQHRDAEGSLCSVDQLMATGDLNELLHICEQLVKAMTPATVQDLADVLEAETSSDLTCKKVLVHLQSYQEELPLERYEAWVSFLGSPKHPGRPSFLKIFSGLKSTLRMIQMCALA